MRQRHRRFGHVEHTAHRVMGRMGEIDHDAEAIEFADDRAAKGVEAAVARRVGGGIDPVEAFVVAKRHQPHAGGVPDTQRAQRILEPHAALDRDEGGDLAQGLRPGVVRSPARRQEHVGMSLLDAADEVDLLERGARGMGRVGGLERGPELRPDHAFAQTRNVGVRALVNPGQIVGDDVASRRPVDPDDPGEIIVPVDQRRALEHIPRHRERIVRCRGSGRSSRRSFALNPPAQRRSAPRLRRWRRAAAPASSSLSSRYRSPWRRRPDVRRPDD